MVSLVLKLDFFLLLHTIWRWRGAQPQGAAPSLSVSCGLKVWGQNLFLLTLLMTRLIPGCIGPLRICNKRCVKHANHTFYYVAQIYIFTRELAMADSWMSNHSWAALGIVFRSNKRCMFAIWLQVNKQTNIF